MTCSCGEKTYDTRYKVMERPTFSVGFRKGLEF